MRRLRSLHNGQLNERASCLDHACGLCRGTSDGIDPVGEPCGELDGVHNIPPLWIDVFDVAYAGEYAE